MLDGIKNRDLHCLDGVILAGVLFVLKILRGFGVASSAHDLFVARNFYQESELDAQRID